MPRKDAGRSPHGATALLLALLVGVASAAEPSWEQQQNIPRWAREVLERRTFADVYAVSTRLNPFLVQGDFDGDGRVDLAILVERKDRRLAGVAIVHAGSREALVLGAGHELGNGGRDFSWLNAWHVYSKGPVSRGAEDLPPPTLKGDALYVEKLESSSAIIYWTGSSYAWYQQGD